MNNPFDWRNYKATLNFDDLEKARRNAYQMTHLINEQRKQGIEPSQPYANSVGGRPQDYTMEMPVMPLNKKAALRKSKREKEKQQ